MQSCQGAWSLSKIQNMREPELQLLEGVISAHVDNGLAQTQVFYTEIFLTEDYAEVDIFPPWKIDKIPFSNRNIFHLKFVNQFLY